MTSVSPTTSASAATATATTCSGSKMYQLPVHDAACGVPNIKNYDSLLNDCARPAGARAYHHDCALYALAIDQSVQDLTDCLYDAGVKWEHVWCSGETNATATGTEYPTATTATGTSTKTTSSETAEASSTGEGNGADAMKGGLGVKSSLALVLIVGFGMFA